MFIPKKTVRSRCQKRDAFKHRENRSRGRDSIEKCLEVKHSKIDRGVQCSDGNEFGKLINNPNPAPNVGRDEKRCGRAKKT